VDIYILLFTWVVTSNEISGKLVRLYNTTVFNLTLTQGGTYCFFTSFARRPREPTCTILLGTQTRAHNRRCFHTRASQPYTASIKRTAHRLQAETKNGTHIPQLEQKLIDQNHESRRHFLHPHYNTIHTVEIENSCSAHEQSVHLSVYVRSTRFTMPTPRLRGGIPPME
jgi:hypothetical protein